MNGRAWKAKDLAILRRLYPDRPTREIAAKLGRAISTVYATASKHGLHKSATFNASPESGRLHKGESRPGSEATRFHPGNVPANKGLRHPPGWGPGRMKETQFKKGQRTGSAAKNWRPIGTILSDTEGYMRIKVREAVCGEPYGFGNVYVWPLLQRQVWKQHRGPIPPGHIVAFKDRNRSNCAIENLECISRADLARRNQMWRNLPRELAEVIQLNGALKRKLRALEGSHEKHG